MAKLLNLSIDVKKITKERMYIGQKGTYLKLTVAINDEEDQFGNTVSAWEEQSQEERQAKEPKTYLGQGKIFWSNDNQQPTPARSQPYGNQGFGQQSDGVNQPVDSGDDSIPF